jgi:4-hydroxybenzoate polyprenyltransferase
LLALNALLIAAVAGALLPIAAYLLLSGAYVLRIRNTPPIDIIAIAGLHGLRIAAGAAAAGIVISPWLAGAALLTFASIGIAKRASDLVAGRERSGYRTSDLPFVAAFGGATAVGAVVVALLYAASDNAALLYPSGSAWAVGPLLFVVMSRLWFRSLRGEITADPLIAGLRDRANWVAAAAALLIFLAAGAL